MVLDDLFTLDARWIFFAFLIVIKTILILLGFLCLIVPGVYLSIRWMFAEYYVIDQGMRPLEALKASSALTAGHRWKLFLFSAVAGALVLLGALAFGIGAVVAGIVVSFASIQIYKDLQSEGQA